VLLAIQDLRADTERLQVIRFDNCVVVKGIVDSDSRKTEIAERLQGIPHVVARVMSYRDLDKKPESLANPGPIEAMSVTEEQSPLDRYCTEKRVPRDNCQQLAELLLSTSAAMARESDRLADLERSYPPTRHLTPAAQDLLVRLVRLHTEHLTTAIEDQEKVFPALGLPDADAATANATRPANLSDAVRQNSALAKKLVYANNEPTESVSLILQDLTASAAEVRTAVAAIPIPIPEISSRSSNPHHD
jgi:hypothetical protein